MPKLNVTAKKMILIGVFCVDPEKGLGIASGAITGCFALLQDKD